MWYRRLFTIPKSWQGQHILLHFGAVDWKATVYINGKEAGTHQGGYGSFTFDITDDLKSGENEVIVQVYNPADLGDQPVGKQTRAPRGYWYAASSGIWQTVWLEPVPTAHITRLDMTPDIEHGMLRLTVRGEGISDQAIEAIVTTGPTLIGQVEGAVGQEIDIPIANAHLWAPNDPFLYDLKVVLKNSTSTVDTVTGYFGMRSLAVGKVEGITRPLLNGKFIFLLGPLDQGFWPDGNYTAPTDEALRFDLEQEKKCGYNLVRKHIKVEPARWYYWADKLGICVLQDMPSMAPRGLLPDLTERKNRGDQTPEVKAEFENEFMEMVDQLRSSPAIIGWIGFNEGWGEYAKRSEVSRLAEKIKSSDPSRLLIAETGCFKAEAGDALDWHTYPGPGSPPPLENCFAGQGEFGGVGLVVKNHSWTPVNKDQDTSANYTAKYIGMIHQVKELMYSPGLSYAIFTQITDVENERNGLLTYDRAVFKGDMDLMRKANEDVITSSNFVAMPITDSFRDEFTNDADKWGFQEGLWKLDNGAYTSSSGISLAKLNFNNFSCETNITLAVGGEAGLMFRVADAGADSQHTPAYYAGISTDKGLVVSYRDATGWAPLQTVPLPIESAKKYHLRVTAFGGTIRVYVDDMTLAKIEASDFRSLNGAEGLRVVAGGARFESFHIDDPFIRLKPQKANRFLTHDSRQKDLVRLDDNVNRTDDALWQMTPGLADARGISFESARNPGFYLRDQRGYIVYEKDDGSSDFKKDTTWVIVLGLANPSMISYESLSHPGEYLRQLKGIMTCAQCSSDGEKSDATFLQMK